MTDRKFKFLKAVLGEDGAKALTKAAERAPELEGALLPRTIMAWLSLASRLDFEGSLPGNENTYLQFNKAEERYSGSVAVGDEVYSFNEASMLHLGACVAVALGADHERLSPGLREVDVQRLGKNIDALIKARVALRELRKTRTAIPLEKMAIANIQPGSSLNGEGGNTYDYSHVLPEQHQQAGYQIRLRHNPSANTLVASLRHNGMPVGSVKGEFDPDRSIHIDDAHVEEPHRGKNLGLHLYEAVMAHGFHKLGAKSVSGDIHSSLASRTHTKLSQRHGLDYKPTPTPAPGLKSRTPGDYDNFHGPYEYAIKDEMDMSKTVKSPQGGQEAPGPAAAPKAPGAPIAPAAPEVKQTVKGPTVGLKPKLPKPPKPSTPSLLPDAQKLPGQRGNRPQLKVTKSEAEKKCPICAGFQFKEDAFQGCMCFRGLAKSVRVTVTEAGYNLEFKADWDPESILTLAEALGKK